MVESYRESNFDTRVSNLEKKILKVEDEMGTFRSQHEYSVKVASWGPRWMALAFVFVACVGILILSYISIEVWQVYTSEERMNTAVENCDCAGIEAYCLGDCINVNTLTDRLE